VLNLEEGDTYEPKKFETDEMRSMIQQCGREKGSSRGASTVGGRAAARKATSP